jgi:hypothetical protein
MTYFRAIFAKFSAKSLALGLIEYVIVISNVSTKLGGTKNQEKFGLTPWPCRSPSREASTKGLGYGKPPRRPNAR